MTGGGGRKEPDKLCLVWRLWLTEVKVEAQQMTEEQHTGDAQHARHER